MHQFQSLQKSLQKRICDFLNICTINKTINVIFNQAEDSNAGHHPVKVCRFHYKSQNVARREMGNPEVEGSDAVVLEAWQVSWWASPGSTGHVCEWRWVDRQRIREAEVMCNLLHRAINQGKTSEKHEPNKRTGSLSNTNIPVDRAVRQQVRKWEDKPELICNRCKCRAKRRPHP